MQNYMQKRKERIRGQRQARAEAPERERAAGDNTEKEDGSTPKVDTTSRSLTSR